MLGGRGMDSQVTFGYSQSRVVGGRDITSRIFTTLVHHGRRLSGDLPFTTAFQTQVPNCKVEATDNWCVTRAARVLT